MAMGAPRMIAFYRADTRARVRRVLLTGPSALTLGGLVIAVSFLAHQAYELRVASAAVGFVLIAGGAGYTLLGMQRILRDDVYVALRTDGVAIQSSVGETLIAWEALEGARWVPDPGALVLERTGAPPVVVERSFARIAGPALAEQIRAARRRVAMGLPLR